MHSLWLACRGEDTGFLIAELWERGTLGITEHDGFLQAVFHEPFDAAPYARWQPRWQREPDTDWIAESRRSWEPLAVGDRLYLVPDWRDDQAPPDRLRLTIHAGPASGTGYSAPTQLALIAIERHLQPGDTVLDVGVGSGILASAAALLGAGSLVACDIDEASATQARANLAADRVPALVFAGSPRSLRAGCTDLVVANLNAVAILSSFEELVRVLRPGGRLILGGFRSRRLAAVSAAVTRCGLAVCGVFEQEDWRCLAASGSPNY